MQQRHPAGHYSANYQQQRKSAISPRHEIRDLGVVFDTRRIAIPWRLAENIILSECPERGMRARRGKHFLVQHATTAAIATGKIDHDTTQWVRFSRLTP
jgi:hypothetical protein